MVKRTLKIFRFSQDSHFHHVTKSLPSPFPLYIANNDGTWKSYTLTKQAPPSAICIFQHN